MILRPGPRNLLTDVDGVEVGNAADPKALSGVTVVVPARRAVAGVDVRGGGPGTRETDALDPACLVGSVDAVVLTGGSVYGLGAADGVVAALGAAGRGFAVGSARAPIVPALTLFDLLGPGDKAWGDRPPYADLGRIALSVAGVDFALGTQGAATGAQAGSLKGGLGSASIVSDVGLQIGALAAVNSAGEVIMPDRRTFWAWPFEQGTEFGGNPPPTERSPPDVILPKADRQALAGNTTIAVVATNADLTTAEATRLAIMAQDGFARAIRPIHTPMDGDAVIALATGSWSIPTPRHLSLALIGALAADCLARAVARGVYEASDLGSVPSYRGL